MTFLFLVLGIDVAKLGKWQTQQLFNFIFDIDVIFVNVLGTIISVQSQNKIQDEF